MSAPLCPVCCDTLGRNGGPTTLPCGHNGCLHCLEACQAHRSECPLCRAPFEKSHRLTLNHQLRDLVTMATRMNIDDELINDGWETFPSPKITSKQYSKDLANQKHESAETASPPTAPPLQDSQVVDVLALEPPTWVPDSVSDECMSCRKPFQMLFRPRHHCRLCGKLYCGSCTMKQMLLPHRFNCREPMRVCDLCSSLLSPCQSYLAATMSVAAQQPVYDVINKTTLRAYLNNPLTSSLEEDVYKCANSLYMFQKVQKQFPHLVPPDILSSIEGVALISEIKVGFGLWSGRLGTGLVVSKRGNGEWSAPSAIVSSGAGLGLQAGGELSDMVIILPNKMAVDAFTGDINLSVGGSISLAVGVGGRRQFESIIKVGKNGRPVKCYTFGLSKGAFAGVSVDTSVIKTRDGVNHNFYGIPISPEALLSGTAVQPPPGASVLYQALNNTFNSSLCTPNVVDESSPVSADQEEDMCCSRISSAHGHPENTDIRMDMSENIGSVALYNSAQLGRVDGMPHSHDAASMAQDADVQLVGVW